MINLFMNPPVHQKNTVVFSRMNYIRDRYSVNLNKVKEYYIGLKRAVPSNHPIVTLLNSMNIPSNSFDDYKYSAQILAYEVGASLNMGSFSYVRGWQSRSWFYGDLIREYIHIKDSDFADIYADWTKLEPVTVDYHPRSDVSYLALDGKNMTNEIGYAVITIDPVMLIHQYKKWRESQKPVPVGERQSVMQFVGMYIIPGMMRSHLNVAFINRISKMLKGEMPELPIRKNLTALAETINQIDSICSEIADKLCNMESTLSDISKSIPVPYGTDLSTITTISKEPPTIATKQYRALRSLPYMELLVSIDVHSTKQVNSTTYSEWKMSIKRHKQERVFDNLRSMKSDLYRRLDDNIVAYIP